MLEPVQAPAVLVHWLHQHRLDTPEPDSEEELESILAEYWQTKCQPWLHPGAEPCVSDEPEDRRGLDWLVWARDQNTSQW